MSTRFRKYILARRVGHQLKMTDEQLKRVEKRLRELVRADWRLRFLGILGYATNFFAFPLAFFVVNDTLRYLGMTSVVSYMVAAMSAALLLLLLVIPFFDRILRAPTRQSFRDCGYPVCITCGYLLEGIAEDAPCPECGVQNGRVDSVDE